MEGVLYIINYTLTEIGSDQVKLHIILLQMIFQRWHKIVIVIMINWDPYGNCLRLSVYENLFLPCI